MKYLFNFFVAVLILVGCVATSSQAKTNEAERDAIIAQKLDCFAREYKQDTQVDWASICYLEDEVTQETGAMEEAVTSVHSYEVEPIIVSTDKPQDAYDPVIDADFYESDDSVDDIKPVNYDYDRGQNDFWSYDNLFSRNNPLTQIEVGFQYFRFMYEEPEVMKDQGNMAGFHLGYTYRLSNNQHIESIKDIFSDTNKVNMFKIEFSRSQGEIHYKSEGTGSMSDVEDHILEVRGLAGYDIPVHDTTLITPYAGFGYRYLNDDTGGRITTTGALGYERENKCYYMPVGFMTDTRINNSWRFGFNFEYDIFLDGQQISHLEDVGPMYTDADSGLSYTSDPIKNEQYEGYGLRASFKLVKLNKSFDLFLQPYVNYWEKNDSDPTQATSQDGTIGWYYDAAHTQPIWYIEPENKSTEYGVKAGFIF